MKKKKMAVLCFVAGILIILSGCHESVSYITDVNNASADSETSDTEIGMTIADTTTSEPATTKSTDTVYQSTCRTVTGKKFSYNITEWHSKNDAPIYWTIDVLQNGKSVQSLRYDRDKNVDFGPEISQLIVEKDVNFDGQLDLLIFRGHFGAQGLLSFQCYLWDAVSQKYVYFPDFEKIPNPKMDSNKKRILGEDRENACTYIYSMYEYEKERLIQTGELEMVFKNNDAVTYSEYELADNDLKLIHKINLNNFEDAYWKGGKWNLSGDNWQWAEDIKD